MKIRGSEDKVALSIYVTINCAIAPPYMYLIKLKRIAHGDANERVYNSRASNIESDNSQNFGLEDYNNISSE